MKTSCRVYCMDLEDYPAARILFVATPLARIPVALVVGPADAAGVFRFHPMPDTEKHLNTCCGCELQKAAIQATSMDDACRQYVAGWSVTEGCTIEPGGHIFDKTATTLIAPEDITL